MSVDMYFIPGAKNELYTKLAKAYDEASKIPGLPDDLILEMWNMRDQYTALVEELDPEMQEWLDPEVPLRDCVERGEYD